MRFHIFRYTRRPVVQNCWTAVFSNRLRALSTGALFHGHFVSPLVFHAAVQGPFIRTSFNSPLCLPSVPLKIKKGPEHTTIRDSSLHVVLDCEFASDPSKSPDVSWYRNHAPIRIEKDKFEVAPNNSLIIMTRNFDNLNDVKGDYMCVGTTSAPSQEVSAMAVVRVKEGVVRVKEAVPQGTCRKTRTSLWEVGSVLSTKHLSISSLGKGLWGRE